MYSKWDDVPVITFRYHDREFPIIRDAILEDTETFTIQLTDPDDDPFALKSPSLTTIFIKDRTSKNNNLCFKI